MPEPAPGRSRGAAVCLSTIRFALRFTNSGAQEVIAAFDASIDVQRYKGLGEINPEQLWETTLDPEIRSLLQVRISHANSAEETFSTLMGDLVGPHRDFIQANALNVANLDV